MASDAHLRNPLRNYVTLPSGATVVVGGGVVFLDGRADRDAYHRACGGLIRASLERWFLANFQEELDYLLPLCRLGRAYENRYRWIAAARDELSAAGWPEDRTWETLRRLMPSRFPRVERRR